MSKSDEEDREQRFPPVETAHERQKAVPESGDLKRPEEVWKDGETTPGNAARREMSKDKRIADAGDLGAASPGPYSTSKQTDRVGAQTMRDGGPHRSGRRK
ncbi:MAG: hypothetical protein ABGX47_11100 [Martelella sp.]|uniref:hypothetical protein n=1 Tax=Martelella sp. TaxID=1969699 RepID=UPI0032425F30